ncbi:putative Transposase [Streptomyces hygroscopicus]|nr:putative Transposase [Streptomyces hygroscopicus]
MGTPTDPRGVDPDRTPNRRLDGVGDPPRGRHRLALAGRSRPAASYARYGRTARGLGGIGAGHHRLRHAGPAVRAGPGGRLALVDLGLLRRGRGGPHLLRPHAPAPAGPPDPPVGPAGRDRAAGRAAGVRLQRRSPVVHVPAVPASAVRSRVFGAVRRAGVGAVRRRGRCGQPCGPGPLPPTGRDGADGRRARAGGHGRGARAAHRHRARAPCGTAGTGGRRRRVRPVHGRVFTLVLAGVRAPPRVRCPGCCPRPSNSAARSG